MLIKESLFISVPFCGIEKNKFKKKFKTILKMLEFFSVHCMNFNPYFNFFRETSLYDSAKNP
ncbi:MAG: hypothetical protein B7Y25_00790 [Alphaproteobacteria bacterium 16-39-46]|nr:MAG: hypothetical protein B7Y25_00790 [Alphaproteobacteria bacterium 16-39-46]OZA44300.1 MAG: hypothetical protein B7X84_01010 [Alphaproteobacteria bacterium 17-39-52]